jgi:hypothetical protein
MRRQLLRATAGIDSAIAPHGWWPDPVLRLWHLQVFTGSGWLRDGGFWWMLKESMDRLGCGADSAGVPVGVIGPEDQFALGEGIRCFGLEGWGEVDDRHLEGAEDALEFE